MVKLPTRDDLGPLPSARTGKVISTIKTAVPDLTAYAKGAEYAAQGQEAMARGLQGLGEGVGQFSAFLQEQQDKDDALAVIRADADLKLRSVQRMRKLIDNDPEHRTWGEKYNAEAAADVEELSAGIQNPELREKFRIQANLSSGLDHERLMSESHDRDKVAKYADLKRSLDKHATRYHQAATQAERDQIQQDIYTDIDAALNTGNINDRDVLKLLDEYDKELRQADATAHAESDPVGALAELTAPTLEDITSHVEGTDDETARQHGFETGYDVPLGYGAYGEPPKPLTQMTLAEVYEFGKQVLNHPDNPHNSSAMGKFQIVGKTMKDFMADAGLTWEDKFTSENQRKLFRAILAKQGFGAWEGYKKFPEALELAQTVASRPPGRHSQLDEPFKVKLISDLKDTLYKVGSPYEAKLRFSKDPKTAPLSPLDPDEKKRVSAIAEEEDWVNGIIKRDEETRGRVVSFVQQWGMVPDEVKSSLEGLLRSPDPNSIIFAMETMEELHQANPRAFDKTSDEMVSLLARYRISGKFQKPEEFAAEIIEERVNPTKAATNEALTSDGKKRAEKIAPYLPGFLYGGPLSGKAFGQDILPIQVRKALGPEKPTDGVEWEEAQQDFIPLFTAAYQKTGDESKALALALPVWKRKWDISNLTGSPRLMKWAPENYVNPHGLDPKWMEVQARARLFPLIGWNDFIIQSDDRTGVEIGSGKLPTYAVMIPSVPVTAPKSAADEGYTIVNMKESPAGAEE